MEGGLIRAISDEEGVCKDGRHFCFSSLFFFFPPLFFVVSLFGLSLDGNKTSP